MDTNEFFNRNSEFYGKQKFNQVDTFFLNFIGQRGSSNKKFLDIGGGSGTFSQVLLEIYNDIEVSIVDPSEKMLDKITDLRINKYQGHLPASLNIPLSKKFDYMLTKEVLHHITNKKISNSKRKVIESLKIIYNLLNDDGYLFIHEIFYESYLFPKFTRTIIFHLLKFQNLIKIQLLPKEFLLGLNVCFYPRKELTEMIHTTGFQIVDLNEINFSNTMKKKFLLLKDWGRVLIVVEKANNRN